MGSGRRREVPTLLVGVSSGDNGDVHTAGGLVKVNLWEDELPGYAYGEVTTAVGSS